MIYLSAVLYQFGVAEGRGGGEAFDAAARYGDVVHVGDKVSAIDALFREVGRAGIAQSKDLVRHSERVIVLNERQGHPAFGSFARADDCIIRVHAGRGVEYRAGYRLAGV